MTAAGLICLFTIALGAANVGGQSTAPPQCRKGLVVDCRLSLEEIVWSLNEQSVCKPYLNRCVFNRANCSKWLSGEHLLKEVPKAECQEKCIDCASAVAERVCAKRGNNFCYFDSPCALEKYTCDKAEMWSRELNRFCDENSTASVCP